MKFLMAFAFAAVAFASTFANAHSNHRPPPYQPNPGRGLSLYELGFSYTGYGCFLRAPNNYAPPHAWNVLNRGGVVVQTTQGYRIMTHFDPIRLAPHLRRFQRNDMIVSGPHGMAVYNRYGYIPYGLIEVFQTPLEAGLCY